MQCRKARKPPAANASFHGSGAGGQTKPLLSKKQLGAMGGSEKSLGSTLYRAEENGQFPGFKIGSHWRFNGETIDQWRMQKSATQVEELPPRSDAGNIR